MIVNGKLYTIFDEIENKPLPVKEEVKDMDKKEIIKEIVELIKKNNFSAAEGRYIAGQVLKTFAAEKKVN